MALYENLAEAYDLLFPQSPTATSFLLERTGGAPPPGSRHALDLGCATGSQLLALAAAGWEGLGLEPSAAMRLRAKEKAAAVGLSSALRFEEGGMLDAASWATPGTFDLLLCLGNTLPHLESEEALGTFLEEARRLLEPRGALVLQLLNYDPIMARFAAGAAQVELPEIRAGDIAFHRRYAPGPAGRLGFLTELEVAGERLRDETLLSPFRPTSLARALQAAGYEEAERYASWRATPFSGDGDPFLIVVARAARS
ncbi:MAG: class I SAM-dependent methyltransferase [Spirochaetaceae bacterium]|nr:class I SAM-dependent methyltransferase [Spirochaetaceae bacterium]